MDRGIRAILLEGYDNITMDDLAKAAADQGEFVRRHFRTKQDFCAQVLEWYFGKLNDELQEAAQGHPHVRDAVKAVINEFIEIAADSHEQHQAEFFRSVTDIARLDPALTDRLVELRETTFLRFLRYFENYSKASGETAESVRLCRLFVIVVAGMANAVKNGAPREILHKLTDLSLLVLDED